MFILCINLLTAVCLNNQFVWESSGTSITSPPIHVMKDINQYLFCLSLTEQHINAQNVGTVVIKKTVFIVLK